MNSELIEGMCRVGRRLQAQGRFAGGTRIGAGALVPDVERLYFALSSVGAKHFGVLPLGEVALVVLVQAKPRPLLVAYIVRGERYYFYQVLRKPRLPPVVLAAFRPGEHFVIVALVKYKRLQVRYCASHFAALCLICFTCAALSLNFELFNLKLINKLIKKHKIIK